MTCISTITKIPNKSNLRRERRREGREGKRKERWRSEGGEREEGKAGLFWLTVCG